VPKLRRQKQSEIKHLFPQKVYKAEALKLESEKQKRESWNLPTET
jgi:hypothetical protein